MFGGFPFGGPFVGVVAASLARFEGATIAPTTVLWAPSAKVGPPPVTGATIAATTVLFAPGAVKGPPPEILDVASAVATGVSATVVICRGVEGTAILTVRREFAVGVER